MINSLRRMSANYEVSPPPTNVIGHPWPSNEGAAGHSLLVQGHKGTAYATMPCLQK